MRKKKKQSGGRCPPKNSPKENKVDEEFLNNPHLQTPDPQETADHQEFPASHKTSDLQETTDPQEIPGHENSGTKKTLGPQETSDSLKIPGCKDTGSQETPGYQKTTGHQETPSLQEILQKTLGPQEIPDHQGTTSSEKTQGHQEIPGTPGSKKTPGPQETSSPQNTPSLQETPWSKTSPAPQETPRLQKTSSPQETPRSIKTPYPEVTLGSQKTSSPQNTPRPQKTPSTQETPRSQKISPSLETPSSLKTPGPSPQESGNPQETFCSSQLRISQCDDAQLVSWTTPDDGPNQLTNLEESPLLPPTAVLIPCRQTDGMQSLAAQETSINDTVQCSMVEPAAHSTPEFDISELCHPVITDHSFTDKSCSPDLSKQLEGCAVDHPVPEKASNNNKEETIDEVAGNSCKAEDTKETSCNEIVSCILTNIGIKHGREPQSDFPAAHSEDRSLPKMPAFPQTEQGRSIPDTVYGVPRNSPSLTSVPHLEEDSDLQVQERDVDDFQNPKTLPGPSISPRLADTQTNLCPLGEKEDVLLQGAECDHTRGAETFQELPDSELLGALEESMDQPEKSEGNFNVITPETSTPSVQGKLKYKALPAKILTKVASTETPRGQSETRREEDASSTVQGLILELSNLNRLIMSTYRDLRQKRSHFAPGRAAAKKRRREK